jgi:hypothetical protein
VNPHPRELAPHPTDPARLRHRRPTPIGWAADLPPDLSARLRIYRAAVLGLLADGYAPDSHGDAAYILGERLGTADGLGLPTHPGSSAWLVAVGESMGVRSVTRASFDIIHTVCYNAA